MTDNERMKKRLAILKQVDRILKHCHCHNTHLKQTCEHCIKLRPLGEQLLKLTKPRMDVTTSGKIVPFREKVVKPIEKPSFSIAIEDYVQAKINKMSDDEFYKGMNVSHHFFRHWKKRNINEINSLKKKLKAK
ncbi:MAG: hypothetical protein ABTA23_03595 [Solibacillus sp.]